MEKYHKLTKEEIIEKLKSMEVGKDNLLPIKYISFAVINKDYDPDSFSQEIEDSEEPIDLWGEVMKETSKPEFDWVWNNTISSIKTNSKEWLANHTKICKLKQYPLKMAMSSYEHSDGRRDYYSEHNVQLILDFIEENGDIVDFI